MSAPVIVRLGLATPLGLSARATQCAVAAGLTGFADTDVTDAVGEPVRASRLARLDPAMTREDRMLFFGQRALAECLAGLDPRRMTSVACYLALPEHDGRPFDEAYVVRGLRDGSDAGMPLDWSARPIRAGRAGVFAALDAATTLLASGRIVVALVGGIDSHCDRISLRHLASQGRTLGQSNPDGLLPGEGAGFLLLGRTDASSAFGRPLGRLLACSVSKERLSFGERNPTQAEGLTRMFRHLRQANSGQPRPQHLFSCQPSESFWARELSSAYLRNAEIMPEPFRMSSIAESLGDAGASSAAVQIGAAFHAFTTAWRSGAPIDRAAIYGAADLGQLGGCIVAR